MTYFRKILVQKSFWSAPNAHMQKFWPILISKICDFGPNSAIFDSTNSTEAKNEFDTTKKLSRGLWDLFGRSRKFFDHPTPKRSIWGCSNFCKIAFFGLLSAVFDSGRPTESQNGLSNIKNFLRALESLWYRAKTIQPSRPPENSIFGVQKFLPSPFRPFLVKNLFSSIFGVSKGVYLE